MLWCQVNNRNIMAASIIHQQVWNISLSVFVFVFLFCVWQPIISGWCIIVTYFRDFFFLHDSIYSIYFGKPVNILYILSYFSKSFKKIEYVEARDRQGQYWEKNSTKLIVIIWKFKYGDHQFCFNFSRKLNIHQNFNESAYSTFQPKIRNEIKKGRKN